MKPGWIIIDTMTMVMNIPEGLLIHVQDTNNSFPPIPIHSNMIVIKDSWIDPETKEWTTDSPFVTKPPQKTKKEITLEGISRGLI